MGEYNDGTPHILMNRTLREEGYKKLIVYWTFESDSWTQELFNLQCIVDEIRNSENRLMPIELFMPYVPNARMDRVPPGKDNVFTLRTFAKIINGMGFAKVKVFDPHSDVTPALIERCEVIMPKQIFKDLANTIEKPMWVFPDAGAMHRYKGLLPETFKPGIDIAFGEKIRDWDSNHIIGYKIYDDSWIKDRNIIIVDDIISHGYTLLFLLRELKQYNPKSVTIYASHVENAF
jgi:ribose-phosphate pyrophosphokinase